MTEWDKRCPNGHTSYRSCGGRYICRSCGVEFDELLTPADARTVAPAQHRSAK